VELKKEEEHESLTMMSEEDLDEAVGQATDDLANTQINGSAGEVAAHEADVEKNGVSANEPAVSQEAPPKEQDQEQHDIEENGKSEPKAAAVPQRGTEVRQLALPIQQTSSITKKDSATVTSPVEIKPVRIGDPKIRSKITFEVVTARVIESAGKKHVAYTIIMKRLGHDPRPAVIERRYNDFCFIYECILKSFHPSILGEFLFPKKVLIGNFKAEVISERTEAFHKFLNLISSCDSLLYSDYFYSFLTSEEHNEAVSHIKLGRYGEAVNLLETIFHIREKLLTATNIMVLMCLCELVACLTAVDRVEEAFAYSQVLMQCFELNRGHPEAECFRVAFLKLSSQLAGSLGYDKKPYDRQLSEMRYAGIRIDTAPPLLEIIRDRYIHRASHTSKLS